MDQNNLFLGAANTLVWPEGETRLRGFRAFFQIPKNGANAVPKNTPSRIVLQPNTVTDGEEIQEGKVQSTKIIRDGSVYVLRNGKLYTVLGQDVE